MVLLRDPKCIQSNIHKTYTPYGSSTPAFVEAHCVCDHFQFPWHLGSHTLSFGGMTWRICCTFEGSNKWYGCQRWGFVMCPHILTHAIAHGDCKDIVRESALKVKSWRKLPCGWPHQQHAVPDAQAAEKASRRKLTWSGSSHTPGCGCGRGHFAERG